MSANDINKSYVSPYDKFMFEFDQTHELSESQIKEINKHQRIFKMRDEAQTAEETRKIWSGF